MKEGNQRLFSLFFIVGMSLSQPRVKRRYHCVLDIGAPLSLESEFGVRESDTARCTGSLKNCPSTSLSKASDLNFVNWSAVKSAYCRASDFSITAVSTADRYVAIFTSCLETASVHNARSGISIVFASQFHRSDILC